MIASRSAVEGITGEAIVVLGAIDWDFIWHWQEISLRLAQTGNLVLYIENTGARAPILTDFPRLVARLRNWWKGEGGFREQHPGLIVLSPLVLPFPYSRIARRINAWLLRRAIRRWLDAAKRSSPVLFTFLPTPLVHDLIDGLDPGLVVFFCAENFAASSKGAMPIEASERQLFRRADLVFVNSRKLQKRALAFRAEAPVFPVGVSLEAFRPRDGSTGVEPHDLASIPHPRCVYVGGLHQWVDVELIRSAAASRPGYHFVLVGPEQVDMSLLRGISNVHLLGSRPHSSLPDYIGACDVGLIPYRVTRYTEGMYPAKLAEYLAMGLPVVSTELPEVLAFSEEHGNVVRLGSTRERFVTELDEALREGGSGRETRLEAARQNGWQQRVAGMSALMKEALEENRARPRVMGGVLSRMMHRYRRQSFSAALALAALVLAVRFTPAVWWLSEPLRLVQLPVASDAIVVLAGGPGESGEAAQGHEERIDQAIRLYRRGYAGKILLSSIAKRTYRESDIMRAIALAQGVRDGDVILSAEAPGTYRMVSQVHEDIRSRGWRRILLISSPYHMRRAVSTFQRRDPGLEIIATPPQRSRFYGYNEAEAVSWRRRGPTWRQLKSLIHEFTALGYYRLRGWI